MFDLWGTTAFLGSSSNGSVIATLSAADANNSDTRFFPGGWRTAQGSFSTADRGLRLAFDNGSTLVGIADAACTAINWPNTQRWYRVPQFQHVERVHIVCALPRAACRYIIGVRAARVAGCLADSALPPPLRAARAATSTSASPTRPSSS